MEAERLFKRYRPLRPGKFYQSQGRKIARFA